MTDKTDELRQAADFVLSVPFNDSRWRFDSQTVAAIHGLARHYLTAHPADGDDLAPAEREIVNWCSTDRIGWLELCASQWNDIGTIRRVGSRFEFITGGSSGNEGVLSIMERNHVMWSMCWESSRRGGVTVMSAGDEDGDQPIDDGDSLIEAADTIVAMTKEKRQLQKLADGWRSEAERFQNQNADLTRELSALRAATNGDVWYYQGDGFDQPASLTCPVVMHAEQFRELMRTPPASDLEPITREWLSRIGFRTEGSWRMFFRGWPIMAKCREEITIWIGNTVTGWQGTTCKARGDVLKLLALLGAEVPQ
jgi:hypothetical protein